MGDVGRPLTVLQCGGGIGLLLAVWSGSADGVAVLAWTTGSSAEVSSALAGGAVQVCPLSRSARGPCQLLKKRGGDLPKYGKSIWSGKYPDLQGAEASARHWSEAV